MAITTTKLTRAAGIAAATAGSIFIAVQIHHPGFNTYVSDTHEWVLRCSAKAVMAVLALVGITGMYVRQARQMKTLGLVGFAVFALGYLLMFCTEMIAVTVLPGLTHSNPGFVNDVVVASGGGKAHGSIGNLQTLFNLTGASYMLGGLLFGIALFRANVLFRWASVLLAVSTVATAALAVLPTSWNRPMAVPEGVALIALGISLWRNERATAETTVTRSVPFETAAI